MINSFIIMDSKPLGVELSALALRTAWACHEKGFSVKLVFTEEGVWCATDKKGYHAEMIKRLIEGDGEVYCMRSCMEARGINEDSLIEGISSVDDEEITEFCEEADGVNYF